MIALLTITIICYIIYLFISERNKYKTSAYSISACIDANTTRYYLVIESKHGKFLDTRELSKISLFLTPNNISPILTTTYSDYESAQNSLQELRKKLK